MAVQTEQPCEQYQSPLDGSDFCRECGCEEVDHDRYRIYRDHEGWWHNDHPLEPTDDCCSRALVHLLSRKARGE